MFRRPNLLQAFVLCAAVLPAQVDQAALSVAGVVDECSVTATPLFSTGVAGIVAMYGGYVGQPLTRSAETDFETRFLGLRRVWLEVIAWPSFGEEVWGDFVFRLNGQPVWRGFACGEEAMCYEFHGIDLRSGAANVEAEFYLGDHCLDCAGYVLEAKLWVEGVSTESPESLFGFAEFQTCFGLADLAPEDCCSMFDANADGKVDLLDIPLIY